MSTETNKESAPLKEMDNITALTLRNSLLLHLQRECEELGVYPTSHPVRLLVDLATTKIQGADWYGFDVLNEELAATIKESVANKDKQIIQSVVDDINRNGPIARAVRACM
jgi:hypothetical protein